MKKSFMIGLCCLWGAHLFLAVNAQAQNWTTVTATNITDLNQQKLAAGQLCFMATDQNDNPISTGVGGGGQLLRRQYCSQVTAGGLPTSFTVPNPATTQPAGVYYRVTVKDSSTGQEVLRYTQVSFSGTSFNFDSYAPLNLGTPAPLSGNAVTGNLSVSGNVTATGTLTASNIPTSILQQIFDSGTGLTQRTAFNCMAGIKCADNAGTARTDVRLGTLNTVTFSSTPIFDASTASTFKLTLTGNVTSSTLTNAVAGEPLAFEICQDATGGRTFVPPANVQGWLPIASTANACSLEVFYHDGTNAQPDLLAGLAGDVTSSPGSTATTVAKIQGTTVSTPTGSGAVVLATSPTLVTPNIGVATATSVNKMAITAPATSATLTIANGKTLTANNTLTLAGTDGTTLTGPGTIPAGGVLAFGVPKFQQFTANGTFTIPAGVTAAKVTVVGAGGAGGGCSVGANNGGGGGAGGMGIKWLSGLTPGNTLTVTVGTGGAGNSNATGNAGGASSVSSGTQTITTVSANGGGGGFSGAATSAGAVESAAGTGGDMNFGGSGGSYATTAGPYGGGGGASVFGGAGGNSGSTGRPAVGSGSGGSGCASAGTGAGGSGANGLVIFEWVQ
jgi:hypothetical protein